MTSLTRGAKIDDIRILIPFLIIVLFVFIWRRWKELNAEVARRRRLEKELEHRATRDPLTELPNRTLFMDRLEHALERTARSKERVAVLFLDLDDFKEINDSFGHQAGDRLLKEVGNRLLGCIRTADTVSRFGGDEFVILIEQMKNMNEASQIAERILNTLTKPVDLEGREVATSASIGIAFGAHSDSSLKDLLNRADAAMYQAKRRGKATYKMF
jgi:diguanylate cyclase (GGDEF)-like protein